MLIVLEHSKPLRSHGNMGTNFISLLEPRLLPLFNAIVSSSLNIMSRCECLNVVLHRLVTVIEHYTPLGVPECCASLTGHQVIATCQSAEAGIVHALF